MIQDVTADNLEQVWTARHRFDHVFAGLVAVGCLERMLIGVGVLHLATQAEVAFRAGPWLDVNNRRLRVHHDA